MKPILGLAALAVLACCPVATRAAGPQGPRLVQASGAQPDHQRQPADAVTIAQSPTTGQAQAEPETLHPDAKAAAQSLEDKLAGFVRDFYLTGEPRNRGDLEELYATTVDYFQSGRLARDRVLRDKQAYFAKWPKRDYTLIRDSLRAQWRQGNGKVLDVTFDYEFDVASPARRSRGRGRAELTLDLTLDGGRITREQGIVLQRW